MKAEIWQIIEVCETVPYEDEEGFFVEEKQTLITILPIHDDPQSEYEIFTRPLKEFDFWKKRIGETFEMTDRILLGYNEEAEPKFNSDVLKRVLEKEKVEFT